MISFHIPCRNYWDKFIMIPLYYFLYDNLDSYSVSLICFYHSDQSKVLYFHLYRNFSSFSFDENLLHLLFIFLVEMRFFNQLVNQHKTLISDCYFLVSPFMFFILVFQVSQSLWHYFYITKKRRYNLLMLFIVC